MIFDTDILIWVQRGNLKAARIIQKTADRYISVQSYMELLQCAQNKTQKKYSRSFIKDFDFTVLPLTENIGHRAAIYIEEFSLSHSMRAGDAIIAATATELNMDLCSSNAKHFRQISDLKLKIFKP